jgi:hypothetical protein
LNLFAQRHQREEFFSAITMSSGDHDIQGWNHYEISAGDMETFLLQTSNGLAATTKGKQPTVQFIHEYVRDDLLSTVLATLGPKLHENLVTQRHNRLEQCYRRYLEKSAAALLLSATDGVKEYMVQLSTK